ncbi:uracil-DNA glycosylase [Xylariaceae sp. FL0016]|nr:uracil-DNA glycosylase [Xylariaceae sp. FL0016]
MPAVKRKSDGALGSADANKKPKVNASITSFFGPPKPSVSSSPASKGPSSSPNRGPASSPMGPKSSIASFTTSSAPTSNFDKAKWVAGLSPELKKHLALEIQTLDPSWLAVLKDDLVKPDFITLKKFLESEVKSGQKVFPPREDVYSWSRHTPFHAVKVVILGQDPYHNVNQAHGLCFSVRAPTPAPPSLKNMYKALQKDYPSFSPPPNNSGLLTPWAERGVLMLNACLTVRAHQANSHANKGWEKLTQRVIDLVAQKRQRGVVFVAWGNFAQQRMAKIDKSRHLVLKGVHPSPLSASRGFFDCGHFRKANEWLVGRYGKDAEIDWNLNPKGKSTREVDQELVTPVVAVGEVDERGNEKSATLEREGEDGEVDEDEEAAIAAAEAEADEGM